MKSKDRTGSEFTAFEELARNLMAVSNVEVREKIAEEKRQKKSNRRSSPPRKSGGVRKQTSRSR